MLDKLTFEQMEAVVGTTFHLDPGGPAVELTLSRAAKVMESESARLKRSPFSLYFQGPPSPALPQGTYALQHATLGRLDMFLVPVERNANGYAYEAVFT